MPREPLLLAALTTWTAVQALAPAATAQSPFTQEAASRGVTAYTPQDVGFGIGIALCDLDGDRDPDLVIAGTGAGAIGVYRNNGAGQFQDRTASTGLATYADCSGIMAFDYDGDGDLDLYVSRWNFPNMLLRNEGGFTFVDVAALAGVADPGRGTGCAAGDYDQDGWLDLYVSNYTSSSGDPRNKLFRNLGNGTFVETGLGFGMDDPAPSFQGIFFDADLDGDLDLYVSNDKGQGSCASMNHLWLNVAGTFVDSTVGTGLGVCINSMGVTIGDVNDDGIFDVYCANTPHGNPLLVSQAPLTWADEAVPRGVLSNRTAWGVAFLDYDNDRDLDLWVANQQASDRLYVNNGAGQWTDQGVPLAIADAASSYCMAVADIDGDGDLDAVVQNTNSFVDLYVNHEGDQRTSARFRVLGGGNNRFAVGARLRARLGAEWQTRIVQAGTGHKSQNEFIQTFGVSTAPTVDELIVDFPGGAQRTLTGYPTGTTWDVPAPALLGDANLDGVRDFADFQALVPCFGAGTITSGCEEFDLDGDADVDLADFGRFFQLYVGPKLDCDANGQSDLAQILLNPALDGDGDGDLDSCEAPGGLVGDLTLDGVVDVDDLNLLIRSIGTCRGSGCPADLNGDGVVGLADLWILLAFWS